jgi:hypothetical protein
VRRVRRNRGFAFGEDAHRVDGHEPATGGIRTLSNTGRGLNAQPNRKGFERSAKQEGVRTLSQRGRDANAQPNRKGYERSAKQQGIRTLRQTGRDSNAQPNRKGYERSAKQEGMRTLSLRILQGSSAVGMEWQGGRLGVRVSHALLAHLVGGIA